MKCRCLICGHEWFSRTDKVPMKCANNICSSVYWNDEQREDPINNTPLPESNATQAEALKSEETKPIVKIKRVS